VRDIGRGTDLNEGVGRDAGIGLSAGAGLDLGAGAGLGNSIGLSEGFWPGIVGPVRLDVVIAERLGTAIRAELGVPVAHLGPAVFLGHAGTVRPDLDFHVEPSRRGMVSAGSCG
jgi:hypothetical protein